jgi:ABC-type Fe3+/spermidine/putrescine transport system ATPase subunit
MNRGEVNVEAVDLHYGPKQVLTSTDLKVAAGEFFTLLGSSGSGKSTLLRVIAGLLDTSNGTVQIDGRDVTKVPTQRRDIGFVFQNYALFPFLTVAENVEYGLKVAKRPAAERAKRVNEMLDLVGLGDLRDRHPHQLSGGQQQRVALGRALALSPSVLLLDEPLGALDRGLRQDLGAEIRRIQQETSTTAVYVTHDQEEAFILSDRLGVMTEGKIVQVGTPAEVYKRPNSLFTAEFLGKANRLDAVGHASADGTISFPNGRSLRTLAPIAAAKECIAVVRPEQLGVHTTEPASGDVDVLGEAVVASSRFHGQRQAVALDWCGTRLTADLNPHQDLPSEADRVWLTVPRGQTPAFSK